MRSGCSWIFSFELQIQGRTSTKEDRLIPEPRTQPGTYQLQRAETYERAAPGAAAHGVTGVPAARLQRDLRAQSPTPVTPEQPAPCARLPAGQAPGPAASFWLPAAGQGFTVAFVNLHAGQAEVSAALPPKPLAHSSAGGPCFLARRTASWGGGAWREGGGGRKRLQLVSG